MKTKVLTLLTALLAFAWGAKADEITGLTLTISHNYGPFFEVPFPAEGWPDLDLTDESSTSIRIKRIEVQTSGTVSDVVFKATMYKTEKGLQPDDDWRSFNLPQQGNTWVLDFGDQAPDLIDDEMKPSPRTFQFFVQAKDAGGNDIFYNNGGEDYKVLFVKDGGSHSSSEITSLKLTLSMNGGETFTEMIPSSGFEEHVLGGHITSLKIHKVEITTSGTFTDIKFRGTMYKTANGGPGSDAEWQDVDFVDVGNGNWIIDIPGGRDLVDGSWDNKYKTFEFYIQGKDNSGNDVLYNNGGENYKVTFSTGDGGDPSWKIKFLEGITAGLTFSLDGEDRVYNFNGAGNRVPEDQLGELSSLSIDQFALQFYMAEGVKTDDVSLQYRVYEDGQEPESWNRMNATYFDNQEGSKMFCYTDEKMGFNVTNGLEPNKDYVLEVNYQVVVDGEYFFLGKDKESSKFRFFLKESMYQEEIQSVILTLQHNNGEPYEVYFDHSNAPSLDLKGLTTSLKIMKIEVWTTEGVQSVDAVGTMYNTADGCPEHGEKWRSMSLNQGYPGYWEFDFSPEGYEMVEDKEQNEEKQKTFQFYVRGTDPQYNDLFYNNDGQDYKVNYTVGGSSGTSGLKNFRLTLSCNGEVFTQSFPKEGWDNSFEVPGNVSSIKLLRAEIDTDIPMTYVGFCWSVYDDEGYGDWPWRDFTNYGDGHWELDWGEGEELIESEWISQNKRKTVVFFVQGGDYNDNTYRYDNGGDEICYRVTFTAGEGGGGDDPNWKVKFYREGTASLDLLVNGQDQSYVFNGDASRLPEMQPGDAYSLAINGFSVSFITNEGVNVKDVSLQYKVYEEGQDGGWNSLYPQQYSREDVWNDEKQRLEHRMLCYSYGIWQDVTSGLPYGCDYVLEVMYQIIADGEYFFLGNGEESCKFRFYYDTETGLNQIVNGKWLNGKCYNLSGQRVDDNYKGLIINAGKKILRK